MLFNWTREYKTIQKQTIHSSFAIWILVEGSTKDFGKFKKFLNAYNRCGHGE